MSNILLDAYHSLGRKINKQSGQVSQETEQGVVSERFPELTLEMENEKLAALTNKWRRAWESSEAYAELKQQSEENENYWKGKHFNKPEVDKSRSLVDNVIFESLETYLPQVTRRNPEPNVQLRRSQEQTPEDLAFANELQQKLGELADEVKLRLKLKKGARHWAIYLLGLGKLGWEIDRDMPTMKIIRIKKIILDPDATIDEDGYTGEYIGEHRKMKADILLKLLEGSGAEEDAEKYIKDLVKNDLGTEVGFIEWWTDQYMCWTLNDHVLLKKKNPHWNYDSEKPGQPIVDEYGNETMGEPVSVPGFNHFPVPKKPYLFLSVFNLGVKPVDDTSLIGQNLSNQDLINKRLRQIDKNADSMNNGMVVSLERSGLTKEQAKGVTEALRKGGTVVIPAGAPTDAVFRPPTPGLPGDVYNQLVDVRNRTRDIFGTRGSSPAGIDSEKTVRGKIVSRTLDTDRVGGGISEYLEQFADDCYNWFVQLLYVYDDHYSQLPNKPAVKISVKEGSLLPKDSLTIANQAIELAGANKMALVDLYKRLDYPNPEELAANVWLEVNAPEILFAGDPRVQQAIQMKQQAAMAGEQKPPSQSISFKDLPPEGQSQMASKVGINLHPEAIAAYQENKEEKKSMQSAEPTVPINNIME